MLAAQDVLGNASFEGTSVHHVRHTVVSVHAAVWGHAHSSCHRCWGRGSLRHCSGRSRHGSACGSAHLPLPHSQCVAILQWQLCQRGCCVSRELQAVGERSLQDLKQPEIPAMPLWLPQLVIGMCLIQACLLRALQAQRCSNGTQMVLRLPQPLEPSGRSWKRHRVASALLDGVAMPHL